MAADLQDTSIIIWDDTPSSPFITELSDTSRKSSRFTKDGTNDIADHALDIECTPTASKRVFSRDLMGNDKENATAASIAVSLLDTPLKTPSRPEPSTISRPTTGRGQMLPPSALKAQPSSVTRTIERSAQPASVNHDPTPSRPRPVRSNTGTSQSSFKQVDESGIDDTCFSTFSAVPEMTLFANLRPNSPVKPLDSPHSSQFDDEATPKQTRKRISPSRSPSPNPRRHCAKVESGSEGTTSLLIDFTQQFEAFGAPSSSNAQSRQHSPSRTPAMTPSRTESDLTSYMSAKRTPAGLQSASRPPRQSMSPSKSSNLLSLLDFELPPPPTPRSAAQFSAREMESLKSTFQSQLSSIKARLSGKEAEVDSLKKALDDAERRVGRAEEETSSEKARREAAETEKDGWERRGVEVERVLASVREEVVKSEAEREALEMRCDEAERRAEGAEGRNMELTTRLASFASRDEPSSSHDAAADGDTAAAQEAREAETAALVQAQLDAKIEAVSRELHAVYKKKHETKVATLKKSYEARAEKRVAELSAKVQDLEKLNADLSREKAEEGFSGEAPLVSGPGSQSRPSATEAAAEKGERLAELHDLRTRLESLEEENVRLASELEAERLEKGELVAAVDEMLTLQMGGGGGVGGGNAGSAAGADVSVVIEDFKRSLSRPSAASGGGNGSSGLRAPAHGVFANQEGGQGKAAARPSGLARPGMGKSRMMSNIERMGSVGGLKD